MKNAFIDANGVLVAWGFIEENNDDTLVEVGEDFDLEPGKWRWDGAAWIAYVAPMTEAQALALRASLMGEAGRQISPLQDAVDLGVATDVEATLLREWKEYRVALNRVQGQPGFPVDVLWPAPPQ